MEIEADIVKETGTKVEVDMGGTQVVDPTSRIVAPFLLKTFLMIPTRMRLPTSSRNAVESKV